AGFPDGPQWTVDEHEVHRWCRMLDWYRIAASPNDLLLHRPAVRPVAEGVTIVHPGAKDPARRWPPARFAELATVLTTTGHDVVVTGSPGWWGRRLGGAGHRVLWHEERSDTAGRRAPRTGWRPPHPALDAITVDEVLAAVGLLCAHAAAPQ